MHLLEAECCTCVPNAALLSTRSVSRTLGKKVAVHSYGPGGASAAVRAGADSLEHATDLDDDTIAEIVRRKVY
jgi:imidazolonepropionase-like amidohydrolase